MLLFSKGEGVLKERFEAALEYVDRVDVLVGFFWFSGLKVFEKALRAHPEVKLRVLVGMATDVCQGQLVEFAPDPRGNKDDATLADEAYERLGRVLGSGIGETRHTLARQAFFVELLTAGRVEVRQARKPNHAKVWLFHYAEEHQKGLGQGRLITGSSNFSKTALTGAFQDELDVELKDWGYPEAQGWFDRLWEDAVPLDPARLVEYLRVREALTPFEAFALALDKVVQAEPENSSLSAKIRRALKAAEFQEFAYQRDAVVQACKMLEAYGGALVADVVGLGKSVIAMLVASASDFGHTGLILCPPGLVENWKGYRKAFGLGPTKWPVLSSGDLEKVKELLQEDPGFQTVIVDEAHRFRNADSQSYADLQTICRGRKVLLLTATPLNNRLDDLAALLGLFLPLKNNPLVRDGDLRGYLKEVGEKLKVCQEALRQARTLGPDDLAKDVLDVRTLVEMGVDKLQALTLRGQKATLKVVEAHHKKVLGEVRELLEKITIRRNRLDLLKDPIYKKSLPPLSRVCDPTRAFFMLDDTQDAFYDRIITEEFGGLAPRWMGPVYQPEDYLFSKKKTGGATQGNIRENMRRMLVRRFESSFAAFAQSLENMRVMYRKAEDFALRQRKFFYARKEMAKLLDIADPEEFQEAYESVLEELMQRSEEEGKAYVYDFEDPDFNEKAFLKDLRADIALIERLQKEMKSLKLVENDPKSARLIEVCRDILAGEALKDPNPAAPRRKILIFSEFADTVAFLGKRLEKAFPGRVCVVKDLGREKRDELRANFDFSCPKDVQCDDYDILVGTDKISEGLNLNRAGVVVNYDIPWNPTRVLQRLGRINRIGGKVFDELHTLNFFPTRRGADVVGNERIAKEKLFNIQKTLGEDVKLFEEGEEPSAAELWERLNGDKEEVSEITKWRGLHEELGRKYPGLFEQVAKRAPNAKSAKSARVVDADKFLPGTYQLRTMGYLPQALVAIRYKDDELADDKDDAQDDDQVQIKVFPITPTTLLEVLHCEQDEPLKEAALHGKAFWKNLEALEKYRDASSAWAPPTLRTARDKLARMEQLSPAHAEEVRTVRKALNEGRLANWWIKQLARAFTQERVSEAEIEAYANTLCAVLADLRIAGAGTRPPAPITQLSVALVAPSK